MPETNALSLLLGAYRRQILGLLLLQPDETYHVREIARQTGVPAGSLHRELKALADAGLLLREAVGNQVRYQANRDNPIYPELAGIFRKAGATYKTGDAPKETKTFELPAEKVSHQAKTDAKHNGAKPATEKLRMSHAKLEALCKKFGIAKLSLFGSASRNELKKNSDVDLMVEFAPDSPASPADIPAMQAEFAAAFSGRKVDMVTNKILNNPFRRDSITRDLKVIYPV